MDSPNKVKENYYKSLPAKRMAAGALLFDVTGAFLIVKPSYKDGWEIPGGVVNQDESPRAACAREIQEELGLQIADLQLLCVDYTPRQAVKSESLHFIFYGGTLNHEQIAAIKLPADELSEWKFATVGEAASILRGSVGKRARTALAAHQRNTCCYTENAL